MLNTAQLTQHYSGIGGSLAPAIMSVDPYITPYQAYLILTSDWRPPIENEEPMIFGQLLEEPIAQEAARRLGVKVRRSNITFRHKQHDWMIAHPDRLMLRRREGMEIKNRSEHLLRKYGEDNSDSVLDSELIQCAHYMAVLDYPVWQLAVLIGGNKLRLFELRRDRELEDMLIEQEKKFWNAVECLDPPPPTTLQDVTLRWPADFGHEKEATVEIHRAIAELRYLKDEIKIYQEAHDEVLLKCKSYMEDASVLTYQDGVLATYKKNQDSQVFDIQEFKRHNEELHALYLKTKTGNRNLLVKI